MAIKFVDVANVGAGTAPNSVVTTTIGGVPYLFVGNGDSSNISAFGIGAGGSLTSVGLFPGPQGISSMSMVASGGQQYLYVSGFVDQSILAYAVTITGSLSLIGPAVPVGFQPNSLTSVSIAGQSFIYVGTTLGTIKGYQVSTGGALVALPGNTAGAATAMTSAVVGGITLLFTAGRNNDSVNAFVVGSNGALAPVGSVADNATLELDGAGSLATAVVGGTTFLFVGGIEDDGISVFRVAANGALTNVDNITDGESAALRLDSIASLKTLTIAGRTYLLASGQNDDGISAFAVSAAGILTNVGNVADAGLRELDGATGITTATIGGAVYMFATGLFDNGVSAFRLDDNAGNNTYVVDSASDVVDELGGGGLDTVRSLISFNLSDTVHAKGAIERLVLFGSANINGAGNGLNNVLIGNGANNVLNGLSGADTLVGGAGNDVLMGGLGIDSLTGGPGNDAFRFSTGPVATVHRDVIKDFANVAGNNDLFQLDNAVFTRLGVATGPMNPAFFRQGAGAADANDFIVYNRTTGQLFYDANGNASGGATLIAVLDTKPVLTAGDFVVI